jgi:hypothetical protein
MEANDSVVHSPKSGPSDGGHEEGWDTQYCQRLQDELLSVRLANDRDEAAHPWTLARQLITDKHPEQPKKFPNRVNP